MIVAAAAVVGISSLLFGSDIWPRYFQQIVPQFAQYKYNLGNASLWGFMHRAFAGSAVAPPMFAMPAFVQPATLAAIAMVAGAIVALAWRSRTQAACDAAYAACVLGMLLASPITWGHALCILPLPALLLWQRRGLREFGSTAVIAVCLFVALTPPLAFWSLTTPGFRELSLGLARPGTVIVPLSSLTTLSVFTHAIALLLGVAIWKSARSAATA